MELQQLIELGEEVAYTYEYSIRAPSLVMVQNINEMGDDALKIFSLNGMYLWSADML